MNEFFLSQLLGIPVITRRDEEVGYVGDVVIVVGELFPKVIGFQIRLLSGKLSVLPASQVAMITSRFISVDVPLSDITWGSLGDQELLLAKELLDKQIVDMDGAKVVRVNDLKLAQLNGDLFLVAADVGLRGLLRRLRIEAAVEKLIKLFKKTVPYSFISWNLVEPLGAETSKVKLTVPQGRISKLHPADIAEIIAQITPSERQAIFNALDNEVAACALNEMEPQMQLAILDNLTESKAGQIMEEMSPDDAADLLGELPEEKARKLLDSISHEEAEEIEELLEYEEDTAGGLMTTEYVSIPASLTVDETIQKLRELSPEVETIYYLYVIDGEEHLIGVLSLRDLIIASPSTLVKDVLQSKVLSVTIDASKEQIANLMNKYDFLAVPVVDKERKLVGMITVDDVLDMVMPARWKRRQQKNFS